MYIFIRSHGKFTALPFKINLKSKNIGIMFMRTILTIFYNINGNPYHILHDSVVGDKILLFFHLEGTIL